MCSVFQIATKSNYHNIFVEFYLRMICISLNSLDLRHRWTNVMYKCKTDKLSDITFLSLKY